MLPKEFFFELQEYVDKHLASPKLTCEEHFFKKTVSGAVVYEDIERKEIEGFVKSNKKPSFRKLLFSYIDKAGVTDSQVYKKAGVDRRHFSKIRSKPDYHPGKNTVIALCLALKLNLKEAAHLLNAAGYTLSDSDLSDLVIKFCLERKIYDINDVNLALEYFSLKPIAGVIE